MIGLNDHLTYTVLYRFKLLTILAKQNGVLDLSMVAGAKCAQITLMFVYELCTMFKAILNKQELIFCI